jgi:hypothetical protein
MKETNREQWVQVLESVARRRPDDVEAEWKWLMEQLGLGPEYFFALHEAVQQGRWRTAADPRTYLKTVARRGARAQQRMEYRDNLVLMSGRGIAGGKAGIEEELEFMVHRQSRPEAMEGEDGVWRAGRVAPGGAERKGYFKSLVSSVPAELTRMEVPDPDVQAELDEINAEMDDFHLVLEPLRRPDWKQWAETAGLSDWEQKVIEYKLNFISREQALLEQPDEDSRRALQAAWRNLNRSGLEQLRRAAKKISKKNVPEGRVGDTR